MRTRLARLLLAAARRLDPTVVASSLEARRALWTVPFETAIRRGNPAPRSETATLATRARLDHELSALGVTPPGHFLGASGGAIPHDAWVESVRQPMPALVDMNGRPVEVGDRIRWVGSSRDAARSCPNPGATGYVKSRAYNSVQFWLDEPTGTGPGGEYWDVMPWDCERID